MSFEQGTIEQRASKSWETRAEANAELSAKNSTMRGDTIAQVWQGGAHVRIEKQIIVLDGKEIWLRVGDNTLRLTERGLEVLAKTFDLAAKADVKIRGRNIFLD